ncbi:bifunctional DNA-formamidopyrimidine glycosylase/DNA-(apurinic or apyrimidinic site) lyase [Candidatus Saccharibacteria bacterium]|nr:bifunctional DNA-formamidopyrimidine glycosylase/DNA-(apurinic or apyrimidinic site) lyase [Candidatus Saccharibacteria bacterium]
MPELPEVETVRRGLSELIIGKVVASASNDNPKSFPNTDVDVAQFLKGASVNAIRRRAKVLIIDLSSDYSLVIHLKMTGQLVFVDKDARFGAGHPNDSLVNALPDKSTRVTIDFTDGSQLFFNDQRKFGWVRLMPTLEIPQLPFMQKVGPEPLELDFTAKVFQDRFKRRGRTNIKAAILDQSVVAGVGNIYADESLWGAKIHPKRLVETITVAEFEALYTDLREVMNLSIEKGGSSNRNYVNAEGKRGSYMDFARVFRREGLLCPRCAATIEKLRVAGRGTHICPNCQTL